jgi:hypothetical protein
MHAYQKLGFPSIHQGTLSAVRNFVKGTRHRLSQSGGSTLNRFSWLQDNDSRIEYDTELVRTSMSFESWMGAA